MPTKAPSPVSYRPDIDCLRAVSVLLVLGFHAFPGLVPTFPFSAKRCKGKTWLSSKKPICESSNDPSPIERDIRRSLEEIATENKSIELLDTKRFFC